MYKVWCDLGCEINIERLSGSPEHGIDELRRAAEKHAVHIPGHQTHWEVTIGGVFLFDKNKYPWLVKG